MTRIMESVEIKAARRQVSQYIWDVNNLPNYLPVSKVEILESGENRTKVRHDFTVAGKTMELVCLQEMADPGRKMTFKTVEGMTLEGTWLLQDLKGATKATYMVAYQPMGGLMGKVFDLLKLKKAMTRIVTEGLQKLKSDVEA